MNIYETLYKAKKIITSISTCLGILVSVIIFAPTPSVFSADITLLHEFDSGVNDGGTPQDNLLLDSGTLYGMTQYGEILILELSFQQM